MPLLAKDRSLSIVPHVDKMAESLGAAQLGSLTKVDCESFLPRREAANATA
jgi:hypothetical protein